MKKIFSFVAAMVFAFAANAAIRQITPTHCFEGDRSDGYTLYVELARGAQAGDTIVMADGEYLEGQSIPVNNNVVVMAAEGAHPVVKMSGYFQLHATAKFEGIKFHFVGDAGNGYCMYFYENTSKSLFLENCEFQDFTQYCVSSWEDFHVDSIIANGCYFHNLAKGPFYLKASGRADLSNTCDKLKITNCTFNDIDINGYVSVIDIRNNDGSAWTGNANELLVDHCTFYNIHGEYNRIIMSYKSANTVISNCIIAQPTDNQFYPTYNYGGQVLNTLTFNTKSHRSGPTMTDNITGDPLFVDAANGNFKLGEGSPALTAATDGGAIGDPRWNVEETPAEPQTKTIYCKMEYSWWTQDGAAVGVYYWGGATAGTVWPGVRMAPVAGDEGVWSYDVPADITGLIFTRVNGSDDIADWGAKTIDLTLPTDDNNLFTITNSEPTWGDPGCTGAWSKYGEEPAEPLENGFYLVGKFGGMDAWDYASLSAEKQFVWNAQIGEGNEEWKVVADLVEGDKVKACYVYNGAITEYFPAGEGNEYVVDANHAGIGKTIYFQQLVNQEWGGHFFIAANDPTAISNTNAEVKAVKTIENGQLVIIKNGIRYNAQGTCF